ncbi:sensor histidine kinase [Trichloromonas sp.]|uniref:sensor histidine kinase n=1 Tax=Trichloromonas sp. TaxID=3069249 RepID=UPI002A373CCD|nr:HAMP domain-containing sensor histidine kinase [Trichloromonas sp.]
MSKSVGLRTEILVNLAILLGAALLFVGFLLLKLTEKELVSQRVAGALATVEVLGRALSAGDEAPDVRAARARVGLMPLVHPAGLVDWSLCDAAGLPVASFGSHPTAHENLLPVGGEARVTVDYSSNLLASAAAASGSLTVDVPLLRSGERLGMLHARFSLADIGGRIAEARRLVFFYVAAYGVILILFGLYLLGRNVVRPIGRLRSLTAEVAGGNLDATLTVEGPREIAELAASFNHMTSSLRRGRDELIRSERMASVGHLAAGMAHEIGNPLGAVVGYLELLKGDLTDPAARDLVERSLAEAGRIDRLVRELLDFAKPSPAVREAFDPAALGRDVLDLLRHQGVFDQRRLYDELPEKLPLVRMDPHRLRQVLVNLLLNARDATMVGGAIRLSGAVEGEWVRLAVRDSGCGLSDEARVHLFDPFYTTKTTGRGLGLAICRRIIEEAGGRIEVLSTPGLGSEFWVWLRTGDLTPPDLPLA